jgi:hypothetical protein
MAISNISRTFGIFKDHMVHFVFIWYIFSGFGIINQEKSGNPTFDVRCQSQKQTETKFFFLLSFFVSSSILIVWLAALSYSNIFNWHFDPRSIYFGREMLTYVLYIDKLSVKHQRRTWKFLCMYSMYVPIPTPALAWRRGLHSGIVSTELWVVRSNPARV